MHIQPFGVEIWMNQYETTCTWNLAETCVDSLTVAQLLALAGQTPLQLSAALLPTRLGYGAIEGALPLRDAIAALYARQTRTTVLTTHGTIGANALVYQALVSAGDRVVSIVPSYQQHTALPASLGADVRTLVLRARDRWLPDLDALRRLMTPGTRLLALTNPNNPTGSLIPQAMLAEIVAMARAADAWILCDEVYRGLDQRDPGTTASIADLYERGISTGSVSKAFSLAGLRVGWIVAPPALLQAAMQHRDYSTISVGVIDEHLATLALQAAPAILARSRAITRRNLGLLSDWVEAEPRVDWVRPESGTTALLRLDLDQPSHRFCQELLAATGVLFTPGAAVDDAAEGHVRIGFANATEVLEAGLARVSAHLATRGGLAAASQRRA